MKEKNSKTWIGYVIMAVMAVAFLYFGVYKIVSGQAEWDVPTAFLMMLILLIIGDVAATATKAFMPGMFLTAVLFVIGFWTFLPPDILQLGGIAPSMPSFLVMMMVVHLGTMLDIQELINQWKTVVITLAGMVGILAVVLTVGFLLVGRETAVIAAGPLTGGLVAAMMMQSVAPTAELAILAMAVHVLQGFVGFPLSSICLKREARNVLKAYREGTYTEHLVKEASEEEARKHFIFPQIPDKYKSDYIGLFGMVFLTVISGYLQTLTGGYVSKFVWALVLGVFASAFGLIDRNVLVRSRSMGFVFTIIMMMVFAGLSSCTPETVVRLIKDFAILIVLAVIGIAALSIPVGRKLGMSTYMSLAIGLGCIAGGFPASYALSDEAAKVCSDNEEEYKILYQHMVPKTLVAGFTSATSCSVFVAGILMAVFFR